MARSPDGGGVFSPTVRAGTTTASANTPSVIFDSNSTNTVSNPVLVPAGVAIVLYADNLVDGTETTEILVQRAIMAPSVSMSAGCDYGCTSPLQLGVASVDFRIPMSLGGNQWMLTTSHSTSIIPVPGMYIFELSNPELLGVATLSFVSMEYKHQLPDNYMMGILPTAVLQ